MSEKSRLTKIRNYKIFRLRGILPFLRRSHIMVKPGLLIPEITQRLTRDEVIELERISGKILKILDDIKRKK